MLPQPPGANARADASAKPVEFRAEPPPVDAVLAGLGLGASREREVAAALRAMGAEAAPDVGYLTDAEFARLGLDAAAEAAVRARLRALLAPPAAGADPPD